jgi:hypothetical protein
LRQVSAIYFAVPAEELDATDIRLEQLADLADALVEQVGAVRAHYEELQKTLDEPAREAAAASATVGGARPVAPAFDDTLVDSDGQSVDDSARLVVMEMAMSGSSRDETKTYLREALELDGGDPIVDEVFDRTEAAQAAPLHRRLFSRRRD